jgi:hypothetical protein
MYESGMDTVQVLALVDIVRNQLVPSLAGVSRLDKRMSASEEGPCLRSYLESWLGPKMAIIFWRGKRFLILYISWISLLGTLYILCYTVMKKLTIKRLNCVYINDSRLLASRICLCFYHSYREVAMACLECHPDITAAGSASRVLFGGGPCHRSNNQVENLLHSWIIRLQIDY